MFNKLVKARHCECPCSISHGMCPRFGQFDFLVWVYQCVWWRRVIYQYTFGLHHQHLPYTSHIRTKRTVLTVQSCSYTVRPPEASGNLVRRDVCFFSHCLIRFSWLDYVKDKEHLPKRYGICGSMSPKNLHNIPKILCSYVVHLPWVYHQFGGYSSDRFTQFRQD